MSMIDRSMIVALCVLLAGISSNVLACSSVAKVIYYTKADIKAVQVIRAGESGAVKPASDMLCVGDRVKVAAGVHITIKYLTRNKSEMELNGPAEFPVTQIELPTKWSQSRNMLADIGKWFASADLDQTAGMVTRGGGCVGSGPITTALDAGHEKDGPFMLDARLGKLNFFWCGGVAPYSVEITGYDGQVLVRQSLDEPSVTANLQGVRPDIPYQLTVRSADGSSYGKKLLFKTMPATPDGSDPFKSVIHLLCLDTEQNWRLQLWSILQQQHDSPIRSTVMEHLQAGDI